MRNQNRFGIGTFLVAMLLISMAFVTTVSAQTTSNEVLNIDTREKEISSQLSNRSYFSNDTEIAENIRIQIEEDMEKEITSSVEKALQEERSLISLTSNSVYLGTDKTFNNSNNGDNGESTWGVAPRFYGSDYISSSNKARAASLVGPGGYGGAGAWSWIGTSFHVDGEGSQTANIRMAGYLYGLTSAAAGGSSSSTVHLVLKDSTTGTEYATEVYSQSEGGVGWTLVDEDFNKGITVNLQAGHDYIAYLKIQTSASVYGVGEAGSDFGPQDGDSDGYVRYYNIKVDF